VTIEEATAEFQYSCYHFYTKSFSTTVGTPKSLSDSTSDFDLVYYPGTLKKKKCHAPTTFTSGEETLVSGTVYKTSKKLCGYYAEYTWTGTNGAISFEVYSN